VTEKLLFLKKYFKVLPIYFELSLKAVQIKLKYFFSYWDSLIIASALESGCSILYTEDMQDGQLIEERLKIVNPFKK